MNTRNTKDAASCRVPQWKQGQRDDEACFDMVIAIKPSDNDINAQAN